MQIQKILPSGDVERYSNVPNVPTQPVSSHSWRLALTAEYIKPGDFELVYLCLIHDCAEISTGDIPFPVKQKSDALKSIVGRLEREWYQEVGLAYNPSPEQKKLIKLCDQLEALDYLCAQICQGNQFAVDPFNSEADSIDIAFLETLPLASQFFDAIVDNAVRSSRHWKRGPYYGL